jgi:preprotein translocase subunit SecA
MLATLKTMFPVPASLNNEALQTLSREEVQEALEDYVEKLYQQREKEIGSETMRIVERLVMLRVIDQHWIEHLTVMENTRQAIGLEGIGQRDPLVVYKRKGHEMFDELSERIQHDIARTIFNVNIQRQPQQSEGTGTGGAAAAPPARLLQPSKEQKAMAQAVGNREKVGAAPAKLGRNDPCYCGSGKKFKKCHGA